MMPELSSIFERNLGYIVHKLGDETFLVASNNDVATLSRMHTLNETGTFIFERIDGRTPLSAIATELARQYEVSYEEACADVLEFATEGAKTGIFICPMEQVGEIMRARHG